MAATWALIAAAVLWGTTGTAASFLPAAVSPMATGAATMGLGGLLLFVVRRRGAIAALRDRRSRGWLLVGSVGVVVYALTFYGGMALAGVAIGNVVALGSGPVFAALLERVLEKNVLTRRWMLCTGAAVVGVVLLTVGGHGSADDAGLLVPGVLLGLAAGAAYALYSYASGRVMRLGSASSDVMAGMFAPAAVVLLIVLLATGAPLVQQPASLGVIAYLAVGPMFVAYLLFGAGLARHRASTATTITLLETIVATVLAVMVVGERLDPLGWAGAGVVLAALAVLVTGPRARP
jgi:DME family drug/metabolite transporter